MGDERVVEINNAMTFDELIRSRRSIRRYQDKSVPLDIILDMIEQCTFAPSAGNGQPWKFVIINDPAMMQRISDESKQNILARIADNPNDYAKRYENMLKNASFNVFYNAPCLVMIVGQTHYKNLLVDCALAASYFMIAATAKGLGTCWVNLGAEIYDPQLRHVLGLPDECTIVAPIILGYPESIPPVPKRKGPEILKIMR